VTLSTSRSRSPLASPPPPSTHPAPRPLSSLLPPRCLSPFIFDLSISHTFHSLLRGYAESENWSVHIYRIGSSTRDLYLRSTVDGTHRHGKRRWKCTCGCGRSISVRLDAAERTFTLKIVEERKGKEISEMGRSAVRGEG
jgi:hypothetical protein